MDKLNEIKNSSDVKEEKSATENSKGNFNTLNSLENRHPYKFVNVADLAINPLDTEISHVESLKSSTMNNFSYYSGSDDSINSYIEPDVSSQSQKEQITEGPKFDPGQTNIEENKKEEGKNNHQVLKKEPESNNPSNTQAEMVASSVLTTELKASEPVKPLEPTTFKEHAKRLNYSLPEQGEVCAICEKVGAKVQCMLE